MRKIVFGTSQIRALEAVAFALVAVAFALVAAGCASTQQQWHQSLLLHENRQLEDALYVAQAQVADLQRENEVLRKQQTSEFPTPPRRPSRDSWLDDWDFQPLPLEMPKVILPNDAGSTEVPEALQGSLPEALQGSQGLHIWLPVR
jgi:hypothetical protein